MAEFLGYLPFQLSAGGTGSFTNAGEFYARQFVRLQRQARRQQGGDKKQAEKPYEFVHTYRVVSMERRDKGQKT